jgi:hypothetical protein
METGAVGSTNILKSDENETNVDNILSNLTLQSEINFIDLIEEITSKKLFLKLKKNITFFIDGKIIFFSNFIRQLCCTSKNFNYRLNLESVERELLLVILQFIDIIEWSLERYMFEVKFEELNRWYEVNKAIMPKIDELAKYLKINHLFEFYRYKDNVNKFKENDTFKTGVDVKRSTTMKIGDESRAEMVGEVLSKNFQEALPPRMEPNSISLKMPIDTLVVKKNATKNFSQRGKFNPVLTDPKLNPLVDALISDSFWFVVCFFQISNVTDRKRLEDLKKNVNEILKRISQNYFKFFIDLCDDDSSIKKKDPVLNMFKDFLSQCVFFSLYLAFPKSRDIFGEDFRNRVISLFSYLFNGILQNNYQSNNWDLDLGKGNIIQSTLETKKNTNKSNLY